MVGLYPTAKGEPIAYSVLLKRSRDSGRNTKPCGCVGKEERSMLWTIAVILLVLWALGLVSSYTMGGFIHLLLVIAIVVVLLRIIQGRRV